MSRNSSGVYALPAGNPVVTGTAISSTWANNTLDDIADALTDSLSRSGDGGMTAPLELDSGLLAAPSLTFSAETTLGLYRVSAAHLGVAVGGVKIVDVGATGVTVAGVMLSTTSAFTGQSLGGDGLVSAPSYSFTNDPDSGMYFVSANVLGWATNGTLRLQLSSGGVISTVEYRAPIGAAATPTYTFTGDTNTGMSAEVADTLVLSTAGVARLTLVAASATFGGTIVAAGGDATTPGYAFASSGTNDGMYLIANNNLGWATNGTLRLDLTGSALTSTVPVLGSAGSSAAPSYSFALDPNTGFYNVSADEIGFSLGGTAHRVGFRGIPINTQNVSYSTLAADSGKCVYKASGGSGETITLDDAVMVAGDAVTIVNRGGGTLTVAASTAAITLAGVGDVATTLTVADDGCVTLIKLTSTVWFASGVGVTAT